MHETVRLVSNVSNCLIISFGVKLGEPLSPILCILFVNDIHSELADIDDPVTREYFVIYPQVCKYYEFMF